MKWLLWLPLILALLLFVVAVYVGEKRGASRAVSLEQGLPGQRPARFTSGWAFILIGMSLPIGLLNAVLAYSTPDFLHTFWFRVMRQVTDPVTNIIPGIVTVVRGVQDSG